MADSTEASKYHGLHLDLPGAPETPHSIAGVNGHYWPTQPTPVGGFGEAPLGQARKLASDKGCPLKLVGMTKQEQDKRRKEIAEWRAEHAQALGKFKPATVQEAERKKAESSAAPKED